MARLLDAVFEFCASLKLAIFLILSLAFYLAAATFYESRFGTPAVQDVIYNSPSFILLMAMLAINVMAAVVIRYPWKRKQTGFIITHAGIEILLLGCLIGHRYAVDGRISLQQGQKTEAVESSEEVLNVTVADQGGQMRRHVFPVTLWKEAGYPSLAKFVASSTGLVSTPDEPRWPEGKVLTLPLGYNASIQILDWMPAAVPQRVIHPSPEGFPSALVHVGGTTPMGAPVDETLSLSADGQGQGMTEYQGSIQMILWKARNDTEVQEFMNPPDPAKLPAQGQVVLFLPDSHGAMQRYTVDVSSQTLGKTQTLGDSGFKATLQDYLPHLADPDQPDPLPATDTSDPHVGLILDGPKGPVHYQLAAWFPELLTRVDGTNVESHGTVGPNDPIIRYYHPGAYVTSMQGLRGRLHLLEGPDGSLYGRVFRLTRAPDQEPMPPFKVAVGQEYPHIWANISLTVSDFQSKGIVADEFRPAHVEARQMDQHMRAMRVALNVDGQRQETWLVRGDQPLELNTPRGPVDVGYGFPDVELGFSLALDHAEQKNDPMSDNPAAWESDISISGAGRADGQHQIRMNDPANVNGFIFSQADFAQTDQGPVSTLNVRKDPGWVIKYLGCALIVGGIFTMFYMKAYFQKTPTPVVVVPDLPMGPATTSAGDRVGNRAGRNNGKSQPRPASAAAGRA